MADEFEDWTETSSSSTSQFDHYFEFQLLEDIDEFGQDSDLRDEFSTDDEDELKVEYNKLECQMKTLIRETRLMEELYYMDIFNKLQETRDGIEFGQPNPPYWSLYKAAPHPSVTIQYLTTIEDIAKIREECVQVSVSMIQEAAEEDENGSILPEVSTDITDNLAKSKSEWKTLKSIMAQTCNELQKEYDQYGDACAPTIGRLYRDGENWSENENRGSESEYDYEEL